METLCFIHTALVYIFNVLQNEPLIHYVLFNSIIPQRLFYSDL